ncbi:MAG TPA: D-glycero-beta-D-manno-heptose-7-phosphate kinase [Pyrinomonadaceae bacterium]|jgi:D-beta-D-heptose 7-phosphate kinase/D-beta-D-heptose 1-phosphate adenosyltransferase|nr:D-glycero-beta-D-manno-heptose-7-phosphate kinase [Pyrinomonadaceae bacterium]
MSQLTKARAAEILQDLRDRYVLVLGDVMLDEFVWGDVTRISPEAPVPVVDVRRESMHLGGAANVLANLVALGARGSVVGVVGNDAAGRRLQTGLSDLGMQDQYLLVDDSRPSTTKTRIIAHSQLVVRADRESRNPITGKLEEKIVSCLKEALQHADAFVVSDYDKGVVTPRILREILPVAYEQVPVLIDPKLRNFHSYRPATLVTPNHLEALRMSDTEDHSDDGSHHAAKVIREKLGCDAVLITRGDRGMMLLEGDGPPVYVETAAREVYDVTGAGDTVIAALAGALASGATMVEAASFANHAAGIVVGKVGTATASAEELIQTFAANERE